MSIKLELSQSELERAITRHVKEIGINAEVTKVELSSTRNPVQIHAAVYIGDLEEKDDSTSQDEKSESNTDIPKRAKRKAKVQEVTEVEEETVEASNDDVSSEDIPSVFSKLDTPKEETPEVPVSGTSLFS